MTYTPEYFIHAYHRGRYEDAIYALMAEISSAEPQYRERCVVLELYADAVTRLYLQGQYIPKELSANGGQQGVP